MRLQKRFGAALISPTSTNGDAHSFFGKLSRLQIIGIFLLYPGFFFYHTAVSVGAVGPILGGFYGPVAGLLLLPCAWTMVAGLHRGYMSLTPLDAAFMVLCFWVVAWALLYFCFGEEFQRDFALLVQSLTLVAVWLPNYVLFRGLLLDSSQSRVVLRISVIAMLIIAAYYAQEGFFNARSSAEEVGRAEFTATYQGFSRSAALATLLLLAVASRRWQLLVYLFGLALLFLLGARSEFVGFLFAGFLVIGVRLGLQKFILLSLPLIGLALTLVVWMSQEFVEGSRIARTLQFAGDSSWEARAYLSSMAWEEIKDNPLFGNYGGFIVYGGTGMYAHNALSAWHSFGLIGFALFAYLSIRAVWAVIARSALSSARGLQDVVIIAFPVAVFGIFLVAFAKDLSFPLVAAAWGAGAGVLDSKLRRLRQCAVEGPQG